PLAAPRDFRGVFRADDDARAVYSEAAGVAQAWPRAVAVPRDAEDVATLMAWARALRQPLIARGSGTSMAGGAVGDGIIVDLSRLDEIGAVRALDAHERAGLASTATHAIRVGPGALRAAVDAAVATHGLRLPVDPSSGAYCTVGGMVATNAAGPHTLSRGAMRSWVVAIECVWADGGHGWVRRGDTRGASLPAIARLDDWRESHGARAAEAAARAVRKDSSGYGIGAWVTSGELVDLLAGSEGTLALFTGLEIALEPRPVASGTLLAAFATLEDASTAATAAHDAGAATCELLDRTLLDLAGGAAAAVPAGTEAVLLASVEGADADAVRTQADGLAAAFRAAHATHVAVGFTPDDEHALWELRHAASPMLAALDPAIASVQVIEDACVPPHALPAYVRGVRAALAHHGFRGVIFGHAGDAHVHVNPLVDTREHGWRARLEALLQEVTTLVAHLGGTLAGEHGDGRLRAPLSTVVWGDEVVARWAELKHIADPDGWLNPGVIVPVRGQRALEQVKYDPALPPLPAAARAALDEIRATRGYARARLELVAAHRGR
ncbi:MAG: FAD-binding oxidoreductase, partial [Gemmatimonadetes bacterium]|nr:FAD-binding oxidoreductase [Gemmatimonadota bacterium]